MTLTAAMRELAERMTKGPWAVVVRSGTAADAYEIMSEDREWTICFSPNYFQTDKGHNEADATVISFGDIFPRLVTALEHSHQLLSRPATAPVEDNHLLAEEVETLLTEVSKRLEQKP